MKLLLLVFSLLFVNLAFAQPISRQVEIVKFHPMAVERTHCPECSGITRLYVNQAPWEDSDCRDDAADLLKEDTHLLSILLTAWTTGKSVSLEVNDEVKTLSGVCKITAAYVY